VAPGIRRGAAHPRGPPPRILPLQGPPHFAPTQDPLFHLTLGSVQVGGAPAWLDPVHLPSDLRCACCSGSGGSVCGRPLVFLLQIYAPVLNLTTVTLTKGCLVPGTKPAWIIYRPG